MLGIPCKANILQQSFMESTSYVWDLFPYNPYTNNRYDILFPCNYYLVHAYIFPKPRTINSLEIFFESVLAYELWQLL